MSLPRDPGRWVGISYRHGGRDFSGCDCFGLIRLVLAEEKNIFLDDPASGWKENWFEETEEEWYLREIFKRTFSVAPAKAHPYDLIYFRGLKGKITHAGLVVDERWFLHSLKGIGSVLSRRSVWSPRRAGIGRFLEVC